MPSNPLNFALAVTARETYWMTSIGYGGYSCRIRELYGGHEFDTRCIRSTHVIRWQIGD